MHPLDRPLIRPFGILIAPPSSPFQRRGVVRLRGWTSRNLWFRTTTRIIGSQYGIRARANHKEQISHLWQARELN